MNIIPYSDLGTNCIRKTTNKTTHVVGYSLDSAPSGDVTVTVTISNGKLTRSPTSLTFTTSNWYTPQIVTYTGVNDGIVDVVTPEIITLSASGGGYDGVSLVQNAFVYDTVTGTYYYGFFGHPSWMDFYHLTNGIETTRSSLISFVFNGNGLPSGTSTFTELSTNYTGAMHLINTSNLTNNGSVRRWRVTWTDVDAATWTHYLYLIPAAVPVGKLLIDHVGHESDNTTLHQTLINEANTAGIDVLYCSMPVVGENVETNSTITSTLTTGHNQMLSGGLDRVGYSPLELFFFDKVVALNHIEANLSYGSNIYMCGISGGGWTATLMGAMDTRIKKTLSVRGVIPLRLRVSAGDYEQGTTLATTGSRIYTDLYRTVCSISDCIVLSTTGNRVYKTIINTNDTTMTYAIWKYTLEKFQELCIDAGGEYKQAISTTLAQAAHIYQAEDRAQILNEL